ncbi:MAG: aminoacyl-tRNA hydrolase [Planctomycetes bacterium]|nr:aminoacyl-tRNA hydrolase [Planctomycetota bacterium]
MKIIFGLGNPGKKYERTRHNLGWRILDRLAEPLIDSGIAKFKKKFQSSFLTATDPETGTSLMLVKPLTYMNDSGRVVQKILQYRQEELTNILIVYDDFQLPFGKIRMRPKGSAGGHNGLASIIETLGTQDFSRLRVGIAPQKGRIADPAKYVLNNFNRTEEKMLKKSLEEVGEAVQLWLDDGIEKCMNKFN